MKPTKDLKNKNENKIKTVGYRVQNLYNLFLLFKIIPQRLALAFLRDYWSM